ncbi:MAG: N-6 DNA methylase [Chloroflexota bacterium]|nr:N-6 DNA methylase [Chloroflexota bacterium]
MRLGSPALTALATDWRKLLFPSATNTEFADGYAQAVTFGLLVARAKGIDLSKGLDRVAAQLATTNSLIGSALRLLTDDAANQKTVETSLGTLVRMLDVVDWSTISKGRPDAWLYFYEDFLAVYDNELRKQTGSYYTPPEVVQPMVGMVDHVLRTRFSLPAGLASPTVTVADPAIGTGTFMLATLRKIAETVEGDEGAGAVPAAVVEAVARLIGFELQLGPFAVAQLRILAELADLIGAAPTAPLRMFVTDTLSNPYEAEVWIPSMLQPIAASRQKANEIKKAQPITVVIGNPPYKEKAKGRGGWVEAGNPNASEPAPLKAWMPPPDWGVGAHTKHLRNLYVYFWRWATWKVFDAHPGADTGIVCFITVAGFLDGDGLQKMRDCLRRAADEIWVIDGSPEGHQPDVSTRIFEGVQQPVCIVLASRSPENDPNTPATVRFRVLPEGHRQTKFAALATLALDDPNWTKCASGWRAAFVPEVTGTWSTYPALEDLFVYNGSGVMPGRTWVIAPDAESLRRRWRALVEARASRKDYLFTPHLNHGELGDRHSTKVLNDGLPGHEARHISVANDTGTCVPPVRYGFRSFDRQWIIPDKRLINRPNPELWSGYSQSQVFATAPSDTSAESGPALTFSAAIPDLHHYHGRGGRTFPLWSDRKATKPNLPPNLLGFVSERYGRVVSAEDLFAYIAAVAAHPGFTRRFEADLATPGLRVPITADVDTFAQAAALGRTVIWLHTFGERFVDPDHGRPYGPPRMPAGSGPHVPAGGVISSDPTAMPDTIEYDEDTGRLRIGTGFIENVSPRMWEYDVSGKHVIRQWFSYRRKNRERPIIGDRRPPLN